MSYVLAQTCFHGVPPGKICYTCATTWAAKDIGSDLGDIPPHRTEQLAEFTELQELKATRAPYLVAIGAALIAVAAAAVSVAARQVSRHLPP